MDEVISHAMIFDAFDVGHYYGIRIQSHTTVDDFHRLYVKFKSYNPYQPVQYLNEVTLTAINTVWTHFLEKPTNTISEWSVGDVSYTKEINGRITTFTMRRHDPEAHALTWLMDEKTLLIGPWAHAHYESYKVSKKITPKNEWQFLHDWLIDQGKDELAKAMAEEVKALESIWQGK